MKRFSSTARLVVATLALAACGTEPEGQVPAFEQAATPQQQLRYTLQYEREGRAVRPAGRDNVERTAFSLKMNLSQAALMRALPADGSSRWPAWESTGSATPLTGEVVFNATVTRDRYDSDFPSPLQVALTGRLAGAASGSFDGLMPGGFRNPDPSVHLSFEVPLTGTIEGYGIGDNQQAALMMLSSVGAPLVVSDEGAWQLEGEMQFHAEPVARPTDAGEAALYDIEGAMFTFYGVTHPALLGAFEGGRYSGEPDGRWQFDFETGRHWEEAGDRVEDRLVLTVTPEASTLPGE